MGLLLSFSGLLALAAGYLLGSIPFGLILTKAAGLGDVRAIGSGNIGATNVLRTGSKGLAAATLLLDALKGTVAVLLVHKVAFWLGDSGMFAHNNIANARDYSYIAGLGALLGHLYPVWLGFLGGKGVATFLGVLIGLAWPEAPVTFGIVWIAVALATRYSSLAALVATAAVLLFYLVTGWGGGGWPFMLIMTALIFFKHQANIRRLLEGRESKIGARS
ncbi:MAG TPA: glycerol-3-phosphate 1-O-acyltransferase PlsY [Hyphomicrobiaceae bacterium]|nr:glycerol-3-phosphate 1-O-acyltransferase PlsY [Hyphomicrobiaceae bacterium]